MKEYAFQILDLICNCPAKWSAKTFFSHFPPPAPKLVVRKQAQALRFLLHMTQAMQGLIPVLTLASLSLERMTSDCSKHH